MAESQYAKLLRRQQYAVSVRERNQIASHLEHIVRLYSLSPPFLENRQTNIDHRLTHPAAGQHVLILNATQSSVASLTYDTIVDKNGGTRSSSHNGASGQATTHSITINLCYFVVDVGRCAIIATEDAND